jgi:hypothetical protein
MHHQRAVPGGHPAGIEGEGQNSAGARIHRGQLEGSSRLPRRKVRGRVGPCGWSRWRSVRNSCSTRADEKKQNQKGRRYQQTNPGGARRWPAAMARQQRWHLAAAAGESKRCDPTARSSRDLTATNEFHSLSSTSSLTKRILSTVLSVRLHLLRLQPRIWGPICTSLNTTTCGPQIQIMQLATSSRADLLCSRQQQLLQLLDSLGARLRGLEGLGPVCLLPSGVSIETF